MQHDYWKCLITCALRNMLSSYLWVETALTFGHVAPERIEMNRLKVLHYPNCSSRLLFFCTSCKSSFHEPSRHSGFMNIEWPRIVNKTLQHVSSFLFWHQFLFSAIVIDFENRMTRSAWVFEEHVWEQKAFEIYLWKTTLPLCGDLFHRPAGRLIISNNLQQFAAFAEALNALGEIRRAR